MHTGLYSGVGSYVSLSSVFRMLNALHSKLSLMLKGRELNYILDVSGICRIR